MAILKLIAVLVFAASLATVQANAGEGEHFLKVKSEPNFIFIGGGGFYPEGSMVTTDKAPETFRDYTFVGWQVDGKWSNENPVTIRMDSSHTAEAIYSKDISDSIIIDTIPRIAEVTIDGKIYLPSELPASFDWATDSEHTVLISRIISDSPTTRYVFDSWKDKSSLELRTIVVNQDVSSDYIALYKTQHFLKPISEYGKVLGGGWHDEGSTVSFELESDIVLDKKNDNIRHVFESWNLGDYQNSAANNIDVEEPTTVKANWDVQYFLQLNTNIEDYNLFGTGWYDESRQVALIAEEELESSNSDTKYVFDRWVSKGPNPVIIPNAHSPSTTITNQEPFVIEAQYKKSYLINVWSPYGSPIGAGFYEEGEVAEISIAQTEIIVQPNKIRKTFTGWDTHGARTMDLSDVDLDASPGAMGQNLLVFMDGPVNVTSQWGSQYYLDLQTTEGKVKGAGWYDIGRLVPISINERSIPAGMWSAQTFDRWTGDIESESVNERVMMNGPKVVIAEWKEDHTPGIINSIILAAVAGIGVLVYSKTRKSQMFDNNFKKDLGSVKEKSFDKFFSMRKQDSSSAQNTPEFYSKPTGKKAILDWLFGRDT